MRQNVKVRRLIMIAAIASVGVATAMVISARVSRDPWGPNGRLTLNPPRLSSPGEASVRLVNADQSGQGLLVEFAMFGLNPQIQNAAHAFAFSIPNARLRYGGRGTVDAPLPVISEDPIGRSPQLVRVVHHPDGVIEVVFAIGLNLRESLPRNATLRFGVPVAQQPIDFYIKDGQPRGLRVWLSPEEVSVRQPNKDGEP